MIESIPTLLLLPGIAPLQAGSTEAPNDLDALLASGLMLQLGATLDRLGGVRGRALAGKGGTAWERGELSLSDPRVLEGFVAGGSVDAVLIGVLAEAAGVGQLLLQARRPNGEEVWSAALSLGEDIPPDARLPLLADLDGDGASPSSAITNATP